MAGSRGFVLSFALVAVLSVTFMFTAVLRVSSGVSRRAVQRAQFVAGVYLAESALLARLALFPDGYFAELPKVATEELGPWGVFRAPVDSANFVEALVGRKFLKGSALRYSEWSGGSETYRKMLLSRVQNRSARVSGNRRFFKPLNGMAYAVENGDLSLNADGKIHEAFFSVEGSAEIKGNLQVDTLLLYAEGPVLVKGNVDVGWLEIYSQGMVRIDGNCRFSGHVWGREGVEFSGKVVACHPSIVLAMGKSLSNVLLRGKTIVEGIVAAPNGHVEKDPSVKVDSLDAVLPFYMDGRPVAIRERFISR